MNLTEHEQKLLLRALDRASAPAEAEKAAEALINLLRKRGINGYDFLKQFQSQSYSRPQEQQRQYQPPPQPPPFHPQQPQSQQEPPKKEYNPIFTEREPKPKFPWFWYVTACSVVWTISHNVVISLIVGVGIVWIIRKRIALRVIGGLFALGLLFVGLFSPKYPPGHAPQPATLPYAAPVVSASPTPAPSPLRSTEPVIRPNPDVVSLVKRIDAQPSIQEQIAQYKADEQPAPRAVLVSPQFQAQAPRAELVSPPKSPASRAELVSPPKSPAPRAELVNPPEGPAPRAIPVDPYTPETRARIKALKARGVREQDISVE